jgi:ring-1,2-phenylacetyl-CoA epoxidase subunit PaaC
MGTKVADSSSAAVGDVRAETRALDVGVARRHASTASLRELAVALADDAYLLGHRDAEWTGLGPILEEDIAFSSMAQDEMGHALVWYGVANLLGSPDPDSMAYLRPADQWRNARLFELPRGDYAFSLARQFLADSAQAIRYEALAQSSHAGIAEAAAKLHQEQRYHLIHGRTTVARLSVGTEESRHRIQAALDELFGYGIGIWESTIGEDELVAADVTPPSTLMMDRWLATVCQFLTGAGLSVPARERDDGWDATVDAVDGGRRGRHGPELDQVLAAGQLLRSQDPEASW